MEFLDSKENFSASNMAPLQLKASQNSINMSKY